MFLESSSEEYNKACNICYSSDGKITTKFSNLKVWIQSSFVIDKCYSQDCDTYSDIGISMKGGMSRLCSHHFISLDKNSKYWPYLIIPKHDNQTFHSIVNIMLYYYLVDNYASFYNGYKTDSITLEFGLGKSRLRADAGLKYEFTFPDGKFGFKDRFYEIINTHEPSEFKYMYQDNWDDDNTMLDLPVLIYIKKLRRAIGNDLGIDNFSYTSYNDALTTYNYSKKYMYSYFKFCENVKLPISKDGKENFYTEFYKLYREKV